MNPVIQAFYQWLLVKGKQKKVALTAYMHTLLITLNAIIRQQQPWPAPPLVAAQAGGEKSSLYQLFAGQRKLRIFSV